MKVLKRLLQLPRKSIKLRMLRVLQITKSLNTMIRNTIFQKVVVEKEFQQM